MTFTDAAGSWGYGSVRVRGGGGDGVVVNFGGGYKLGAANRGLLVVVVSFRNGWDEQAGFASITNGRPNVLPVDPKTRFGTIGGGDGIAVAAAVPDDDAAGAEGWRVVVDPWNGGSFDSVSSISSNLDMSW